jgi:hypothetical protein
MDQASSRTTPPFHAPQHLAQFISEQAIWRRAQARRFPNDERNARSAEALEQLAVAVARRPYTDQVFDQMDRLGAFADDGTFRGGPLARKAIARHGYDPEADDQERVLFDLIVAIAEENAVSRKGDRLEVDGPRGRVIVNLGPDRPPAGDGVRWLDPEAINVTEAHVRVDQTDQLRQVLALYDELTGLFMPEGDAPRNLTDERIAVLVALESGLFGHLRSARAAVVDGRIQDIVTLSRTIEEVMKRAAVAIADPAFARRFARNERVTMKDLDDRYAQVLEAEGRARTGEQGELARGITDKSSWVIHARHQGLQFMARPVDGGSLITREPVAVQYSERGRDVALWVLAIAGDAVHRIVPVLLEEFDIPDDEWRRRERAYADRFAAAFMPNLLRRRILQHEPNAKITVNARGVLVDDVRIVPIDEALRRAGLDDPDAPAADRAVLAAARATAPNWWGGMPLEQLKAIANDRDDPHAQAAGDEMLRRGYFADGLGNWVEDRPDTTPPGRSPGRIPSVSVPRTGDQR